MKFVLLLALLGVVSCRTIIYREDGDDDEADFRGNEEEDDDEGDNTLALQRSELVFDGDADLRSSFWEKGSPLSPEARTSLVLPTAHEKTDDIKPRKLQSSFWEKGSPLSPEARTSMVLPIKYEVIDL